MKSTDEIYALYWMYLEYQAKLECVGESIYFTNGTTCYSWSGWDRLDNSLIRTYNTLTWQHKLRYRVRKTYLNLYALLAYNLYYRWRTLDDDE